MGRKKGFKHSEEMKLKLSLANKGYIPTKATLAKIRAKVLGQKRITISNENHPNWKGEKASYSAIHHWLRRKLGKPLKCSKCGKIKGLLQWANKSGFYKRDLNDYVALCAVCHNRLDKTALKGWITKRKLKQQYA